MSVAPSQWLAVSRKVTSRNTYGDPRRAPKLANNCRRVVKKSCRRVAPGAENRHKVGQTWLFGPALSQQTTEIGKRCDPKRPSLVEFRTMLGSQGDSCSATFGQHRSPPGTYRDERRATCPATFGQLGLSAIPGLSGDAGVTHVDTWTAAHRLARPTTHCDSAPCERCAAGRRLLPGCENRPMGAHASGPWRPGRLTSAAPGAGATRARERAGARGATRDWSARAEPFSARWCHVRAEACSG